MIGKCGCCGKVGVPLNRNYFNYPIKCECHSPNHYVVINHCNKCTPVEPKYTTVEFLTEDLKNPVKLAISLLKNSPEVSEKQFKELEAILMKTEDIIKDGVTIPASILAKQMAGFFEETNNEE